MPSFCVLGKYQRYGSDDLVLPAGLEALTTGTWLITFGYIYAKQYTHLSCSDFTNLHFIFVGGIIMSAVNLGLLMFIVRNTLRGTVINAWPRRTLHTWFGIKAGASMVTTVSLVTATKWVYWNNYMCDEAVISSMKQAIKYMWVNLLMFILFTIVLMILIHELRSLFYLITLVSLCLVPVVLGLYTVGGILLSGTQVLMDRRIKRPKILSRTPSFTGLVIKTWTYRVHQLSRFLGLEGHSAFMRLGRVMACIFYDDPEIVPSDVIACLFEISHKQVGKLEQLKNNEAQLIEALKTPDCSSCKPKAWMTVSNAAHYMKFALACYGWSHYVYTSRSALLGFLRVICRSRYVPRSCPEHIHGDSGFLSNTTAVTMASGLPVDDFVHITFENELYELPFCVVLDHEKRSIVVAVRGTISMQDVVTDLISFGESITCNSIPNAEAHEGMHISAKNIFKKLVQGENPILVQARRKLERDVGNDEAKSYQLVVTGHSLGAGVAAILAILLREVEEYKDLICFAFSTPGGLLSIEAARYTEEFVCSVVIEDDIISRLGLIHMYKFKLLMLNEMKDLDVPKHEVFRKPLERVFAKLFKPEQKCTAGSKSSWEGNPEAAEAVQHFQVGIDRAIAHTEEELSEHRQLYLPGCVMYVQGLGRGKDIKGYFTRGDSRYFQEILLCNSMIRHHFPIVVLNALKRLKEQESIPCVI